MKIVVVMPGRKPVVQEIDGTVESMQEIVGGLIQPIYPFDDPVALVCNDEGKLMNLPANRGTRMGRFMILCAGRSSCAALPQTATALPA